MSVFYWADPHFGQPDVAAERGFASPDEHDDYLIARWCETVTDGDEIWILGDLALSSPDRVLEIIRYLPGTPHLVWGNHDRGHPMHPDAERHHSRYLDVFATAAVTATHTIGGRDVVLSHFPYREDSRTQDRYRQHRPKDEGRWLIHGHVHDEFAVEGRQINVGVDKWRDGPVEQAQLLEIITGDMTLAAAA
jgi:calcineurin-like phosphoesterase family protein